MRTKPPRMRAVKRPFVFTVEAREALDKLMSQNNDVAEQDSTDDLSRSMSRPPPKRSAQEVGDTSLHMSVHISVHIPVHMSIHMSVLMSVLMSVHLSVHLSALMSIHMYMHRSRQREARRSGIDAPKRGGRRRRHNNIGHNYIGRREAEGGAGITI